MASIALPRLDRSKMMRAVAGGRCIAGPLVVVDPAAQEMPWGAVSPHVLQFKRDDAPSGARRAVEKPAGRRLSVSQYGNFAAGVRWAGAVISPAGTAQPGSIFPKVKFSIQETS